MPFLISRITTCMNYWLCKTEADCYSIDDLRRDAVTAWDGVRNYQARNFIRDDMQIGDPVFIYHSNTSMPGIVGLAQVVSVPYPDPTQFDPQDDHFDSKSTAEAPRWFVVDLGYQATCAKPMTLAAIKSDPALAAMKLVQKGQRLSILPVTEIEYQHIFERLIFDT